MQYNQLKLIIYRPDRTETEVKLPISDTPNLDDIIKGADFVRVQTDYFALAADIIRPKLKSSPVMGVLADTEQDYSKSSLADFIARYFQFSSKKGILKEGEDIKAFKDSLLHMICDEKKQPTNPG